MDDTGTSAGDWEKPGFSDIVTLPLFRRLLWRLKLVILIRTVLTRKRAGPEEHGSCVCVCVCVCWGRGVRGTRGGEVVEVGGLAS